jgi:hypothetical protein
VEEPSPNSALGNQPVVLALSMQGHSTAESAADALSNRIYYECAEEFSEKLKK